MELPKPLEWNGMVARVQWIPIHCLKFLIIQLRSFYGSTGLGNPLRGYNQITAQSGLIKKAWDALGQSQGWNRMPFPIQQSHVFM